MKILLDIDKNKIFRIATISIVFLALMLTFQWYYGKNVVTKKLQSALFQNKNIVTVDITKERERITIYLTLKDVDNLMEVYNNIYDAIEHQLKGQPFEVKIINNANSAIKDLFDNEIQFIMYEAIQTGKYTEMKARLDEIKNTKIEKNISEPYEIKVFIDTNNLYLQIKHGKSNFYKVFKQET